jgi:hypothetical protein
VPLSGLSLFSPEGVISALGLGWVSDKKKQNKKIE